MSLSDELRDLDDGASDDTLALIKQKVQELRDLLAAKAEYEERLKEAGRQVVELTERKIPEIMDEAGVPEIKIEAEGNHPAFAIKVSDRYYANIPVEHAPEAYEFLRASKADDIIKRQYTVSFGLGDAADAAQFEKMLEVEGYEYDLKEGVPWNTLTAWFREEYKRRPMSVRAMAVLGASVGRIAKVVKPKKEKP